MKPSDERKILNDELNALTKKPGKHKDDYNRMDAIIKRLRQLEGALDK